MATPPTENKLSIISEHTRNNPYPELTQFVIQNLPKKDQAIWLAALIIREHFDKDERTVVSQLKKDIVTRYPGKGGNIANLCTTGYLENHIVPLHDYLVKESSDERKFLEIYDTIVNELPYAVFSSRTKSLETLVEEILGKIKEVSKYGWRKVSVHGIGEENVKKIKQAMIEVESECEQEISTTIEADNRLIKITFHLNGANIHR